MSASPGLAALLSAAVLFGCSGTQDVLQPAGIAAVPAQGAEPASEGDAIRSAAAVAPSDVRLQIDPIVGAGLQAAIPLTERLAAQARTRRIAIAASADPGITHVLKGYFSTIAEGRDTTIIYVWDIYDAVGNRLHRINGQRKVSGGAGDWSAATPVAMQAIADDTMDRVAAWLSGRST